MKLTKKQIQNLYKFTKQHYVYWYDLQSELVDHLANDIEQIWQEQPQLSFEEAKNKAFKKFGIFGFMDVVEKRQKALSKHYYKLFWKAFLQFFTIPKIAFTISMFFTLFYFVRWIEHNRIVILILASTVIIVPFIQLYKNKRKLRQKEQNTGKKYMFEEYITNLGGLAVIIQIPFQLLSYVADKEIWTFNMEIIFTATIIICVLSFYITVYELPPKVRAILAKEHPEYQIN